MVFGGLVITVRTARWIRRVAEDLLSRIASHEDVEEAETKFGLKVPADTDPECLEALMDSLRKLPPALVKECGLKSMRFKDMGPSKKYYPNHGVYSNGTLILNSRILDDPLLVYDSESGSAVNKFDQTFYHELGHGWDEVHGKDGKELSRKTEWTSLSGWSEEPKKGLKRLVIHEKGAPEMKGEWWFDPDSGFTRFYAKRNPWDDWADSFSYYVAGMKSFLPKNKIEYFDKRIGKHFSSQGEKK